MYKKKHLILAFKRFDTGGLQTLMLRMAKWCKNNDVNVTIIYQYADERMEKELFLTNAESVKYKKHEIVTLFRKAIDSCEEIRLVTFELPEFLYFENIINQYFKKNDIYHLIYNVAVSSTIYGNKIKFDIAKKICYWAYRKIIVSLVSDNRIIFMDSDTLEACCNYYNLNFTEIQDPILLLPMYIEGGHFDRDISKYKIVTVSRAVFPYKGYLISLIDHFDNLKKKLKEAKLIIVSYGPGIDKLRAKISQSNYKEYIQLVDGASMKEIDEIMSDAWLYIGMGTTVLDAANMCVPVIPTWHSTMECITSGFFCDNPQSISKCHKMVNFDNLIYHLADMNSNEYKEMCIDTFKAYENNYDINKIMPKLLNRQQKSNASVPFVPLTIHNALYCIKKVLGRYQ